MFDAYHNVVRRVYTWVGRKQRLEKKQKYGSILRNALLMFSQILNLDPKIHFDKLTSRAYWSIHLDMNIFHFACHLKFVKSNVSKGFQLEKFQFSWIVYAWVDS